MLPGISGSVDLFDLRNSDRMCRTFSDCDPTGVWDSHSFRCWFIMDFHQVSPDPVYPIWHWMMHRAAL